MRKEDQALSLEELCARSDFTERTVRYYIQRGLLPSPGTGRGARYGMGHLYRLRLIKRMQAQHLPLAEIEKQLAAMSEREIAEAGVALRESRSSASEYIESLLSSGKTAVERREKGRDLFGSGSAPAYSRTEVPKEPQKDAPWTRWDRMPLSDDVELNVKRPMSREMNRKIERIVAAARRILDEE